MLHVPLRWLYALRKRLRTWRKDGTGDGERPWAGSTRGQVLALLGFVYLCLLSSRARRPTSNRHQDEEVLSVERLSLCLFSAPPPPPPSKVCVYGWRHVFVCVYVWVGG